MPPQYASMQQPYNGKYGVQQLYPPLQQPSIADDRFGATSVIMPIQCCGGPMLLASIELFCTIQGKVKNDIASLFYACMVLLALSFAFFCIACVWICKHPPSSALCLIAMMCMSVWTQCCGLLILFCFG
jgi:hypothetical protein